MNHDRQDKSGEIRCDYIVCGDPTVCCVYFATLDSADANMWSRDNYRVHPDSFWTLDVAGNITIGGGQCHTGTSFA